MESFRDLPQTRAREAELESRLSRARAVLLDLDGTLVSSHYDWVAIRAELEISGPSIIDSLNGLDGDERGLRWLRMREIESQATRNAECMPGAPDLLSLLRSKRMKTALVTNNSLENASLLLNRFELEFDLVLTRDDGFWKPSGRPLQEAMLRLRAASDECFLVGDSRFDLLAARDAGCPFLAVGAPQDAGLQGSDRILPDLEALNELLQRLL